MRFLLIVFMKVIYIDLYSKISAEQRTQARELVSSPNRSPPIGEGLSSGPIKGRTDGRHRPLIYNITGK
jgi:hypothetical protein